MSDTTNKQGKHKLGRLLKIDKWVIALKINKKDKYASRMVKDLNRCFSKADMQKANKHMKNI